MCNKGILFILSGPSGAGKGTVLRHVLEKIEDLNFSISVTTREPRRGEIDGINYLFKTKEEFQKLIDNNEFLEYVNKYGNRYGTLKSTVNNLLDSGCDVILEIETVGAKKIKKVYRDAVLIFITPSNPEEIGRRLYNRQTEDEKNRERRLKLGYREMQSIVNYNYIAINDSLLDCVDEVEAIIRAERAKIKNNKTIIERLLNNNNYIK